MTESFGMQLDDDSLLALFSRVCPCALARPAPSCPALPCPAFVPLPLLPYVCPYNPWLLLLAPCKQFTFAFSHEEKAEGSVSGLSSYCEGICSDATSVVVQHDPQASGVIDYQALMKQLLHSDYYALYLGTVDNTQNTLDATSTFDMITNLKRQFAAQGHKLQQVCSCKFMLLFGTGTAPSACDGIDWHRQSHRVSSMAFSLFSCSCSLNVCSLIQ